MNSKSNTNILIVNQHGENRGDEAAMRAMVNGISNNIPNSRFTMICQFMDRNLNIKFDENIKILSMLIPAIELPGLAIFILFKIFSIECLFFLKNQSRRIILEYRKADIILSAPGGPYFGDIYSGFIGYHELAHWLMIIIAKLYNKPAFLYSPSAGPFKIKWLNPIRRYLFRYFIKILIREEISKQFLEELLPSERVYLTADSALQKKIEPISRKNYFNSKTEQFNHKYLVSVSANDYKYPLTNDPIGKKENYIKCMVKWITYISELKDSHFIMFPQLYGSVHSDVPFLKQLGSLLPTTVSWEIFDPKSNSDEQQAAWGMTDFTLASRYHPQIFSAMHGIPYLCIYYEHKQLGFIKSLGLEEYAFDIYTLDSEAVVKKIKQAIENRKELSMMINQNIEPIIERAKLSSILAVEAIKNVKLS